MPSLGKKLINTVLGRNELAAFMKSPSRNEWITHKGYQIYLRKSERKGGKWLDLASIQKLDEKGQPFGGSIDYLPREPPLVPKDGKLVPSTEPTKLRPARGRFREVVADIENAAKKAKLKGVYVEQIHNKFLPDKLGEMGYGLDAVDLTGIPSMRKRT